MANPYPALITDANSETRIAGQINFTDPANQPGGSSPVGVYLQVYHTPIDIHANGSYPIRWDDARDDPWNFNQLAALPAGLGIATAIDGSDGTLTTTEAGVWAFTLGLNTAPDTDWRGLIHLDDNTQAGQSGFAGSAGALLTVTEIVSYPAGAYTVPTVGTAIAAVTNPFNVGPWLLIVRLG